MNFHFQKLKDLLTYKEGHKLVLNSGYHILRSQACLLVKVLYANLLPERICPCQYQQLLLPTFPNLLNLHVLKFAINHLLIIFQEGEFFR